MGEIPQTVKQGRSVDDREELQPWPCLVYPWSSFRRLLRGARNVESVLVFGCE